MTEEVLLQMYWGDRMSLKAIGEHFQRSPNQIQRLLKKHDIPRRPASPQMKIKKIGKRWHKLCTGPSHENPEWVLAVKFYQRKDGKPRSWCIACELHRSKRSVPLVDYTDSYYGFVRSIVNRLGVEEAARRMQISQQALWQLRFGRKRKIKRKTAESILRVAQDLRQSGEVRHRDSIRHGSYLRGRKEKVPVRRQDFYRKDGDTDNDRVRENRHAKKAL